MDSPHASGEEAPSRAFRLGVMGTLIWDRILDLGREGEPVEGWGGIAYSLEALSVALPTGWVAHPILKVGEDLAEGALEYLNSIPRIDIGTGVRVVPFKNYRVELHNEGQERRLERLVGGVPSWGWEELEPLVQGVDAIYLNFITGSECSLETAQQLKNRCPIPVYADLHSLFLGRSAQGLRFPRALPKWESWFRAFDVVQMNRNEFELMAGDTGADPWEMAAGALGEGLKLITVTMGPQGSAYLTSSDFLPDPSLWPGTMGSTTSGKPVENESFPLPDDPSTGDPTGCGDVWGATFFARLLGGSSLEGAMTGANRFAALNVDHHGTSGLHEQFRGAEGA